jgi:cytochrome c-type biogenesis protein CcmH/NrfF
MKNILLAPLAVALLVLAAPGAAQKPPPSGDVLEIHPEAKAAIDRIKSPYCPGMMLEVCTSAGGAMLRDSIQRLAEGGLSHDSIVNIIIADYGEEWRAEPLRSGTGLWAWLIPPGMIVAGLSLVGVVLARRRSSTPAFEGPEPDAEAEARIRAALKVLDEEEEPVF